MRLIGPITDWIFEVPRIENSPLASLHIKIITPNVQMHPFCFSTR